MTDPRENTFKDKADLVMSLAKKLGADQSSVRIRRNRSIEVVIRNDNLDLAKVSTKQSLDVRLYLNGRLGSFTTSDLREQALKDFVSRGVEMTRALTRDPYNGLPDPERYVAAQGPDLRIYDPKAAGLTPETCVERAQRLVAHEREIAREEKLKPVSADGYTGMEVTHQFMAASNGLSVSTKRTECYAYASVAIQDTTDKDKRRRDWWGVTDTSLQSLGDSDTDRRSARKAIDRCVRRIGATSGPSGAVPVVVENVVADHLLKALIAAASGGSLYRKTSYLAGMIDKPIASSALDLRDDPLLPGALGSSRYDVEGVKRKPMPVILSGTLKNYYLDTYYARALHLSPTIASPSNLVLSSNCEAGCADLVKTLDKGMLITGFLGGNFNSTTGQFSYGILGQWIENGKTVRPVEGMNVSGNHAEIWKKLIKVGNDTYLYSKSRTPSVLFSELILSGAEQKGS